VVTEMADEAYFIWGLMLLVVLLGSALLYKDIDRPELCWSLEMLWILR
jgi:hypothetical protein